jgi:hypothetical protein
MLKQLVVLTAPAVLMISTGIVPLLADGPDEISFNLVANPKFAACLAKDAYTSPTAKVTVSRGTANDVMIVQLQNFKPGAAFDLFTIERTNLKSDGTGDADFKGSFGLAWYQSDIHVGDDGKAEAVVKSILLDGIFGFDADPIPGSVTAAPLVAPTHTFHVGFWFDGPQDAATCGFDPTKPTPFNSEHKAGPNAMISVPDPVSGQGPLLTVSSLGAATPQLQTHCPGGMCLGR